MKAIEVLSQNMVMPALDNSVFFRKYARDADASGEEQEVSAESVITLVLRASQLYQAHREATEIFKMIVQIEQSFKP